MKTWVIIVIVLFVIMLTGIILGIIAWNNIKFKPYFGSVNLSTISLADASGVILEGQEKKINAIIGATITNDNWFAIPFSNLRIKLYYNGTEIATTSNELSKQKFTIPENGVPLTISDNIILIFTSKGIGFLKAKLLGGNPSIDYSVSMNVFGIPIPTITNSFTW